MIMKIVYYTLITIIAFVGCNGCNNIKKMGRVNSSVTSLQLASYTPLKEFKGDTLKCLETNFLNRKKKYINENLGFPTK